MSKSSPVIGVFEDSDIAQEALVRAFKDFPHEAVICVSPEDAIQSLQRLSFDFIICDGRGWQKCYEEAVRLLGKEKVLIYSSYSTALSDAFRLGVTGVDKTISLRESAERVRDIVVKKLFEQK